MGVVNEKLYTKMGCLSFLSYYNSGSKRVGVYYNHVDNNKWTSWQTYRYYLWASVVWPNHCTTECFPWCFNMLLNDDRTDQRIRYSYTSGRGLQNHTVWLHMVMIIVRKIYSSRCFNNSYIHKEKKVSVYIYLGLIWPLICCHHFMEYRFRRHSDVHGFWPYKSVWTLAKHSLQRAIIIMPNLFYLSKLSCIILSIIISSCFCSTIVDSDSLFFRVIF